MKKILIIGMLIVVVSSVSMAAERNEFGISQQLVVSDRARAENRSLIKFELGQTVQGKDIDYAAIDLQFEPLKDGVSDYIVFIHPVKRNWTDIASWGANKLGSPVTDYIDTIGVSVVVSAANKYRARAILTPVVKLWAEGAIENLGLIILSDRKDPERARLATMDDKASKEIKLEVFSADK